MKWFFYGALGFAAITFLCVPGIVSAQDSPAAREQDAPTLSSLKLELDVRRAELLKPQRELQEKYEEQLNRLMDQVTEAGDLDKALAVKTELAEYQKGKSKPTGNEFPELKRLQEIYAQTAADRAGTLNKKLKPVIEAYKEGLLSVKTQLTREKKLEEAVKARALIAEADEMLAALAISGSSGNQFLDSANTEKAFENSLGMKFVPVPITGGPGGTRKLLFSIWETRVRDYEFYVKRTKTPWSKSGFIKETENHPAVLVNWEEAKAFCEWLTEQERDAGKIGLKDRYRLPTDHEWSCAVGIGRREDPKESPRAKHSMIADKYPWDGGWPPITDAGNYCGEETLKNPIPGRPPIEGYDDGFVNTAPVGSFSPNDFGLYDLNGNVLEWCEDALDPANPTVTRVLRGGSWSWRAKERLLSSYRVSNSPLTHSKGSGFRCVLETAASD